MQMLLGADYITAARRANVVGAFVASQRGAIPEYRVEDLIQ